MWFKCNPKSATLPTVASNREAKCPSAGEWIGKGGLSHGGVYHPAAEMQQSSDTATTRANLKPTMPSEQSHAQCDPIYMKRPEERNPKTESRLVVARGWAWLRGGRNGKRLLINTGLTAAGGEGGAGSDLKSTLVMNAQSEHSENLEL